MMRFQKLAIYFLTVGISQALPQQSPPDLSGVWRLNPQASHFSGSPPVEMWVRVEQNGPDITITIRGEEETVEKLRIGSDDNLGQIHGAAMKSAARWDGSTLAIDSVATFGADELHMSDRWTLSPGGQALTFQEHHQFKAEPAGEETMVFEKQRDCGLGAFLRTPDRGAEIQEHSGHEGYARIPPDAGHDDVHEVARRRMQLLPHF